MSRERKIEKKFGATAFSHKFSFFHLTSIFMRHENKCARVKVRFNDSLFWSTIIFLFFIADRRNHLLRVPPSIVGRLVRSFYLNSLKKGNKWARRVRERRPCDDSDEYNQLEMEMTWLFASLPFIMCECHNIYWTYWMEEIFIVNRKNCWREKKIFFLQELLRQLAYFVNGKFGRQNLKRNIDWKLFYETFQWPTWRAWEMNWN